MVFFYKLHLDWYDEGAIIKCSNGAEENGGTENAGKNRTDTGTD